MFSCAERAEKGVVFSAGLKTGKTLWQGIYEEFSYEVDDTKVKDRVDIVLTFFTAFGYGVVKKIKVNKDGTEMLVIEKPLCFGPAPKSPNEKTGNFEFIEGVLSGILSEIYGKNIRARVVASEAGSGGKDVGMEITVELGTFEHAN